MNVRTKKKSDFSNNKLITNPTVLNLYLKHKFVADEYIDHEREYNKTKKYYVYIWFANTNPRRIFYVGRGTRDRYNHILKDIKKYREKKTKNNKFKQYSMIQDKWSINYEIVLDKLSEYNAIVYE